MRLGWLSSLAAFLPCRWYAYFLSWIADHSQFRPLCRRDRVGRHHLVTVAPIGARPSTITSADLDRAIAFVVMSALFAIAYPRRILPIALALILAVFLIELAQYFSVTRHPQFHDALVKAFGVLIGVSTGRLINRMSRRGEKLL
ncbi:VanZ family protein [Agrobacterium sp. RAC06]|uniref:VanZ family protein n=1 Tax=Agrobacterium sp. RAC06 TaxID=1842536 RepID=UPI001F1823D5|nr:hypothetical protein [Agrobacterium sp. RAC06]